MNNKNTDTGSDKLHIILIGNYKNDRQMSMILYAEMLKKGYAGKGHRVDLWHPVFFLGALFKDTTRGAGKWFSYIDKWVLFPLLILFKRMNPALWKSNVRFHICDHSNAIYLNYLDKQKTLITCHDVLAIRGALGYKDAFCEASRFGVVLQKWIMNNLLKARKIATVSQTTLNHLRQFPGGASETNRDWRVVLCAFNSDFYPMNPVQAGNLLKPYPALLSKPFILHVGSGLPRKNRKLLVEMLSIMKDEWPGIICFAGEGNNEELNREIEEHRLSDRVVFFTGPKHEELIALYSSAAAFIFPSYSEGFGMPLIEAQMCGTCVVASNVQPMPEISGNAALHEDPDDAAAFAADFLNILSDGELKNRLIQEGFENCKRFKVDDMIDKMLDLMR